MAIELPEPIAMRLLGSLEEAGVVAGMVPDPALSVLHTTTAL